MRLAALVVVLCALGAAAWLLVRPALPPAPPAAEVDARALLDAANVARAAGDLRAAVEHLRAAVERAPSVETHAALGALYLELGVAAADRHLEAAAAGDPQNPDRWIALANAEALKPDPGAAAAALEHARAVAPGISIVRDARGWLVRSGP